MFLVVKYQTRKDEIYTLNILLINGKVKYCLAKNMLQNDFFCYVDSLYLNNLYWLYHINDHAERSPLKSVFFLRTTEALKSRVNFPPSMRRIFFWDFPCVVRQVPDRILPHNGCNCQWEVSQPTSSSNTNWEIPDCICTVHVVRSLNC
jgi:hypothetical protein